MKFACFVLRALLLCALAPACISTYAPAAPVAPLLDEAGDVALGGGFYPVRPTQGGNVFVAAAPSDAARVFVAGSFSRMQADDLQSDYLGRSMHARNRTNQVQVGGGYGFKRRHFLLEALGAVGFGRTSSAQCEPKFFEDQPEDCRFWADSRSWFTTYSGQVHAVGRAGPWQGGGGVRMTFARYQFEELFDRPSRRVSVLPVLEPYIVQRVGLPLAQLELGLHFPLVLHTPEAENHSPTEASYTWSGPLFLSPGMRLTCGVVFNVDEVWRKRAP